MNQFLLHIPACVDADRPTAIDFETTEQLLQIEQVRSHAEDKDFSHFAMSGELLMSISNDGFFWWVVGSIRYPEKVNLPKWDGGKYKVKMPNGEEAILTSEQVVWTSGDTVALRDGGQATRIR